MGTFIKIIKIITITALMLAWISVKPAYAASLVVNTNADNTTAGDGFCTLREAINNANSDSDTTGSDCVPGSGADIISFAGNYTITLGGSQLPVVTTTITINGNGPTNTILQANAAPNVATNRIFEVSNTGNLTLNGLTVRNGRCSGICPTEGSSGGGVYNLGTLTLNNNVFSSNSATIYGAGIFNFNGGVLTVINSTFSDNFNSQAGGGIFNFYNDSKLTVTNSVFSNNSATVVGGGLANSRGSLEVINSTFLNNSATFGGGAHNAAGGILTVTNSIFFNNTASRRGGGISNSLSVITVTNSTFFNNSASNTGGALDTSGQATVVNSTFSNNAAPNVGGGGVFNSTGTTLLSNTILVNNSNRNCFGTTITADSSNITDGPCDNATQATSAQINLQPPANNGGPTQTMAIGPSSIAIDAGNTTVCANSPVNGEDQRGVTRLQGAGCDVGAYEFDDSYPIVVSTNLVTSYTIGPNSFTVTFNENVNDSTGNTDTDDVTNPDNYLLVENGVNETFDTTSCAGGRTGDDTQVVIDSVSYNATSYTSAVNINSGTKLPNGKYRLFVCGTTSIVDIALNPLNNGISDYTFDFTVATASSASSLPNTGFAPNRITHIPIQPASLAYTDLGAVWLEIPSLKVTTEIVGVPQSSNGWNVDWLGQSAGWLNGTAFPSWEGNSVLTGHVYDANGKMGPFANIKNLKHGDQIIVHLLGEKYIFEVRNSDMVSPSNTKTALEHLEGHSYLTLITCQGYNPFSDSYFFRRVVRAVLVEVKAE